MSSTAGKMGTSDTSAPRPEPTTVTPNPEQGNYLHVLRHSLLESARKCRPELAISHLLENHPQLELDTLTGKVGLERPITYPYLQRAGLALMGYDGDLIQGSLLWLGAAEISWLAEQRRSVWADAPGQLAEKGIAGLLVQAKTNLSSAFIDELAHAGLPLLKTELTMPALLDRIWPVMSEHLSPQICFNGNLLVISGLGVLILGKSGIGKSDDALDLIMHGHQLVADDVVQVHRNTMGKLIGTADELTRQHMTIRGLGIVNIKELFGITAIIDSHPIDLILFLEPWEETRQYALQHYDELEILDVKKPMMRLPVAPGRNLENLITVAVKTHVLRTQGYNAEERLSQKLNQTLANQREKKPIPE